MTALHNLPPFLSSVVRAQAREEIQFDSLGDNKQRHIHECRFHLLKLLHFSFYCSVAETESGY